MAAVNQSDNGKFPIVGVGASAGGLEAFLEFFRELRVPAGMGFVLVTHLEPNHESQLTEIVSSATPLTVVQARDGAVVEPDHLYILPPNAEIEIRGGALQVSRREESLNPHFPIDRFLQSLAEDQGKGAVAIILSGGGSDGAQGLRAVKVRGGTTFCQDPASARHPSMPHNAAETGAVDFVLPPAEIAREILKLQYRPYLTEEEEQDTDGKRLRDERSFSRIVSLLKSSFGVDFGNYKPNTINRRIGRRMLIHHVGSLEEYVKLLESQPQETEHLYRDLLICVTSFFREPEMFEAFSSILAKSMEERRSGDPFRIWAAGCASGEEAYSFAILASEAADAVGKRINLQVFGTDISDESIERARKGIFPENIQQNITPERLRKYFVRVDSGYRIAETIRQSCVFARHDLTSDPPFSHMDLIACRNVLIYLSSRIQDRILQSLHYGLNSNGTLILGSAETISTRSDLFAVANNEHKIFLKKSVPSRVAIEFGQAGPGVREIPEVSLPVNNLRSAEVDADGRAARILRDLFALFEQGAKTPAPSNGPDAPAGQESDDRLEHANRDLDKLREVLRNATEQYEAVTEELRAANEEARSANEELQSTNEELRTAKEELQSSNEELTTVNDELRNRNDELRLVNNDLTNVLGAATIPILMVGMDLRLRRFTPAAERLLSLSAGDIGQSISVIQHGFNLTDLNHKLQQAIENLEIYHERTQDRRGRWFEVFVRPYRTVDNRIEGAVLAFIDIDDLVRALDTAESARLFAEAIVNTVQHPLVVLDADLRVLRASEAFYRMFQTSAEQIEGKLLSDIGAGQWAFPGLRSLLDAALVRDVPFRDLDLEHEFAHLGRRTLRLNARRITSRDRQPHRLLLAIEDVTERKETAELQYRRLFESAKDGILILDAKTGIVVDANPYFTELTRYTRSEVVGKRFGDLEPFLESEEARRLMQETSRDLSPNYESVRARARDGKSLILAIVANQYTLKEQDFIQVNIRDVTERRRMEDRLRRNNLDLQQFAFAASHDLQEPLRTVTGFSQLLKHQHGGKLTAEADRHLEFIVAAAERMSQMVLDLLGYSQVVRAEANPVAVSVEAVLATALMNLQMAIRDSNTRVTFDPLPTIRMDQTLLLQLLQNLIGNAIKYRSEARPEIHLSSRDEGTEWVFSIRDNGIGIDPQYAEHIFTVFKRLHGREYPGTGIGLAICKRIVEGQGGTIWVESAPGKGSTFFFSVLKNPLFE